MARIRSVTSSESSCYVFPSTISSSVTGGAELFVLDDDLRQCISDQSHEQVGVRWPTHPPVARTGRCSMAHSPASRTNRSVFDGPLTHQSHEQVGVRWPTHPPVTRTGRCSMARSPASHTNRSVFDGPLTRQSHEQVGVRWPIHPPVTRTGRCSMARSPKLHSRPRTGYSMLILPSLQIACVVNFELHVFFQTGRDMIKRYRL